MCGDIDVVFTECDQCHPRCMSKVLCMQKERALSDSENKMPEPGLIGGGGIQQLVALSGNTKV